jgi:hypothetical protein
MDMRNKSIDVVCCYAREDRHFLHALRSHLSPLQREESVTLWADIDINAGEDWDREIRRRLDTAHIILLLISPDFINSEYCYGVEMRRALERHERREARVVPIIVRPVSWPNAPFSKLQALPKDATPITRWANTDDAFHNIVEGIRKVINSYEAERANKKNETGQVHLAEEERLGANQEHLSPMVSRTLLATASPQTIMSSSPSELPQPTIPVAQFGPIKNSVRGIRLLVFWIVLVLYWLIIGYTTPLIFPDEILRISGSTYLTMLLQGNSHKTQILKILVVLFSLTVDWFVIGIILSLIPHPSLFTLQDASVYGPILVGICAFLLTGYVILYFLIKWPYTNVINLRKIIEITAVTALMVFVSKAFNASFLYFPIVACAVSLCLFTYGIVSLGGTPYNAGLQGSNETLERRRNRQKERDDQSKAYFDNRKSRNII